MNSTVRPIFNKKSYWKVRFMGPVSSARDSLMCWNMAEKSNNAATVHEQCMNSSRNSEIFLLKRVQKKKKEEGKHKTQIADADNSYPNRYL